MTMRTITSLYDTYDDAAQTVRDLEAAGVPHDRISMPGHSGACHRLQAFLDRPHRAGKLGVREHCQLA